MGKAAVVPRNGINWMNISRASRLGLQHHPASTHRFATKCKRRGNYLLCFPFLWDTFLYFFYCLDTIISFCFVPYFSEGVYLWLYYFFSFSLYISLFLFCSLSLISFLYQWIFCASASKTSKGVLQSFDYKK